NRRTSTATSAPNRQPDTPGALPAAAAARQPRHYDTGNSGFDYAAMMDCAQMALSLEIKTIPAKKTTGKVVDFLTEDALRVLLAQPDPARPTGPRNQVFMVAMYDTAARCAEMLDLRVRDLRLDTAHPVAYLHGKGGKTRIVPLLPKTVEHLKRHLRRYHPAADGGDLVFFTTAHGRRQPMSPDAVAAFFKTYGDAARRQCHESPDRCHPHQLRHTRAIHLYRQGMPLPLLSEYLGHASVESTKIYAYADSEMKRAAIEKADALRGGQAPPPRVWEGDEDMILQLAGLT
ncbi:MAG: tyrosine-type recombinase/integrase, partial [Bifidobacteriaceae bacterium]|nr:tyrosine-type recombinase/integrase [Bifidobacteriaceae bacterium]